MREGKKKKTKFSWNTDEATVDLDQEGKFCARIFRVDGDEGTFRVGARLGFL